MTNGTAVDATNQYVVPYNPYLLAKYKCHLNIEIISTLRVLKYIFKYLYKGFDKALVECIEKVGTGDEAEGVGQMTFDGHLIHPKNIKIPPGVLEVEPQDCKTNKTLQQRQEQARRLLKKYRIQP